MPQLLEKDDNIIQFNSKKELGNQLFPIFVKLNELTTLVVGGGNVGLEKLVALLDNSHVAKIKLIAESIRPEIYELVKQYPQLELIEKSFDSEDLIGVHLVLAATNDNTLNETIRVAAHERNLLINVADKPDLCDFYLGSIVKKGDLKIAISTNGKSPTIAKRLKQVLKESIPEEIDHILQQMSALRLRLKGDFAFKVKKLNAVTASLVDEQDTFAIPTESKNVRAKLKWLLWTAIVFSIAVGVFVFWHREPDFQLFLQQVDPLFYYFLAAGFTFAMVDGAIGMSYGVTSSSFSLAMGIPPAPASMGIHLSEVLSNGIAGWMHYKMGNVNWKLFKLLLIPGVVGAIIGAYLLSSLEHYSAYTRPIVAIYTSILGIIILLKAFNIKRRKKQKKIEKIGTLGFFGGFIDAAFGGGWGSIVLSSLIAGGRHPLFSLGTVKITRFFIAILSSITFISMLGGAYWEAVLGLVIGSSLAAPIAAKVSNRISAKTIMVLVGIIVLMVSLRNVIVFIMKIV
ncbi:TSUP family transporter [Olivibacter sp. SDN3]|uniref:TSUP family transporter n=1 Tax=Olivibacter sp. SDN3 TaxID=2764720 RepID=UPI001651A54E|nr:TSUP family transporter [Olivibacter sp. SDN3]QNL48475.1 TSUP family transporter [Olivibacter sp. SDN3]